MGISSTNEYPYVPAGSPQIVKKGDTFEFTVSTLVARSMIVYVYAQNEYGSFGVSPVINITITPTFFSLSSFGNQLIDQEDEPEDESAL